MYREVCILVGKSKQFLGALKWTRKISTIILEKKKGPKCPEMFLLTRKGGKLSHKSCLLSCLCKTTWWLRLASKRYSFLSTLAQNWCCRSCSFLHFLALTHALLSVLIIFRNSWTPISNYLRFYRKNSESFTNFLSQIFPEISAF